MRVGIYNNRRPFNLPDADIRLDEDEIICLIETYDELQSPLSPDPMEQLIQLKKYHYKASERLLFFMDKLVDQYVDIDEVRAYLEAERQRDEMADHRRIERSLGNV
jgi:hypothetical protein